MVFFLCYSCDTFFKKGFSETLSQVLNFKAPTPQKIKHTQTIRFSFSKLGSQIKDTLPNHEISHTCHEILISVSFIY